MLRLDRRTQSCEKICGDPAMTFEEWQRVKSIVAEASLRDPASRAAFVATACGGDAGIHDEVSSLLISMDHVGDQFEVLAFELPDARAALEALVRGDAGGADAATALVGQRIGPYEIRRELGRGGMGAVYLAARVDEEFSHQVALKIIKRGMDTDAIVRRFRTERQILAGLNHANITRLLDGGTVNGLPYLVMEYVDGDPITSYCDSRALGIADRLRLFRDVCGAVGYAHQHLVVHRDIKPSNVLVTPDGQPKLLDFGLATILDPDVTAAIETQTVHLWLTPEFASPEQVLGTRVTTASDVYSLGVLLYELLCGRRPFRREPASGPEWIRAIVDEQPDKPSAALTRAESAVRSVTPAHISAARGMSPDRLRRTLRGDLDNIALKALDKDPARRYSGAQELAEDVRRHLARLPVVARGDSFTYHATRFVRRHKTATVAATLVAATLVAATAVTTAQARVARRERELADRRFKDVRRLANAFLFDFHDAIAMLPGATAAREMVVKTAQQYLDSLAQEAGTDHQLLAELATAYLKLADVEGKPSASRIGDTEAALRNYERALALRRRIAALEPSNAEFGRALGVALVRMGPIFQVRGDPKSAVERTREGMQIIDRLVAAAPSADMRRDAFRAPFYLGDALLDMGDYDAALAMYQKALAIAGTARHDPPESDYRHRLAVAKERLGIVFTIKGDYDRALESHREALKNEEAMRASAPGNADYTRLVANGYFYVGDALMALKQYHDAKAAETRALAMYEQLARADPRDAAAKKDIGGCTHKLAETLLAAGDLNGAELFVQRAVAIRRGLAAQDAGSVEYSDDLADSLTLWGESLLAGHTAAAAIDKFHEARVIREPIVASRSQQSVYARGLARLYTDLGDAYMEAGSRSDAAANLDQARRWYERARYVWTDLSRRHALWASEADAPSEVSRKLVICEARRRS